MARPKLRLGGEERTASRPCAHESELSARRYAVAYRAKLVRCVRRRQRQGPVTPADQASPHPHSRRTGERQRAVQELTAAQPLALHPQKAESRLESATALEQEIVLICYTGHRQRPARVARRPGIRAACVRVMRYCAAFASWRMPSRLAMTQPAPSAKTIEVVYSNGTSDQRLHSLLGT
jgi:hypothetical protein